MKPKQSSPIKSELGKKRKGEINNLIISLENSDVKQGLQDAMTLYFQSLAEIHKLMRKAREVSDGN